MSTPQRPTALLASIFGYAGASALWLTAAIATLFAIPESSRHYADLRQDADAGSLATFLLLLTAGLIVLGAAVSALLTWLDAHGWPAARWLTWIYSGLSVLIAAILLITDPFAAIPWHRWLMIAIAILTLLTVAAAAVLLGHPMTNQFFRDYRLARQEAAAQRRAARLQQLSQVPSHLYGAPHYPNTYPHNPHQPPTPPSPYPHQPSPHPQHPTPGYPTAAYPAPYPPTPPQPTESTPSTTSLDPAQQSAQPTSSQLPHPQPTQRPAPEASPQPAPDAPAPPAESTKRG